MVSRNEGRNRKKADDFSASKDWNAENGKAAEVEVHLLPSEKTNPAELTCNSEEKLGEDGESCGRIVLTNSTPPFLYNVYQSPPFLWTIVFGFQQAMISISSPLVKMQILSDLVCAQEDNDLQVQILSSTLLMIGLSTFAMCTIGVRLPIFQGPSTLYLIPLLALKSMDEWKCPRTFKALDPTTNATVLMADIGNGTYIPNRDLSLGRISVVSGSLVAVGVLHFFIGICGLVGVLTRYIGPVTIVPTIALMGLQLHTVYVRISKIDWTTSITVTAICLILALYLANLNTPIPKWTKRRGFHIHWQPVHQVLSILFSLILGCILCAILTATNFYSDDPEDKSYRARINSKVSIISETKWFILPYPGQFGPMSFNSGIFLSFVVTTLSSVLDSIGDYTACARIVQVSPPPYYAFNRGIFVEGLMSTLSGFMGCCHATVSYGSNIGALRVTKVTSLRVLQVTGLIFIAFAIFGKLGAIFVSIPSPILGGILLVTVGIFMGMLISCLQSIDLNSTRNVAIIGMALILGMAIPHWIATNPDGVNTGNKDFDEIISMLLSNPSFVGGIFCAFLDNTIPGSWEERGLLAQMEDLSGKTTPEMSFFQNDTKIYRLPFLPKAFRRSRITKYIPIFDATEVDPE